ncbi:MAG: TetR/AcrR family transcriptional regulator [Pseudomonadales bacterium]|nr:TetR/AcrR family transcriptional regulator [Pseudomonadales bacterium]MDG2080029.1 TetR/AcrR family transcriptional regulator [Pseudomonadales bacterium]
MKKIEKNNKPDGRIQRSERSRQLIVDAVVDLINEGHMIPTAQQVADKAGVAIRTVFRHFSEMEKLYAEIDQTMRPWYAELFSQSDRSGTLEERVTRAVESHAGAYTELAGVMRAVQLLLWRSPQVKQNYLEGAQRIRKDMNVWLPELASVSPETREAVDAITSFDFWERLTVHQKMSRNASIELIANLVLGQLQ